MIIEVLRKKLFSLIDNKIELKSCMFRAHQSNTDIKHIVMLKEYLLLMPEERRMLNVMIYQRRRILETNRYQGSQPSLIFKGMRVKVVKPPLH